MDKVLLKTSPYTNAVFTILRKQLLLYNHSVARGTMYKITGHFSLCSNQRTDTSDFVYYLLSILFSFVLVKFSSLEKVV